MDTVKRLFLFVIPFVVYFISGCANDMPITSPEVDGGATDPITAEGLLQSEVPRNRAPEVTASEVEKQVTGNNSFGIQLFKQLHTSSSTNLFISPYSISSALTMAYAGARNGTAQEIAGVLELALPDEKVYATANYLDISLMNTGKDSGAFTLNIANAVWGQTGYPFQNDFLAILAENFGAGLRLLDFYNSPEESRITINGWVEEKTENRIQDLLPPESVTPLTTMVLTNAVYFLAEWKYRFTDTNTHNAPFFINESESLPVPTMYQQHIFSYGESAGCQIIELPYKGDRVSMLVLLPEKDIETFVSSLTMEKIRTLEDGMYSAVVTLSMPKFEFTFFTGLRKALYDMGMRQAFSGSADFSGISKYNDLFISDVLHKAFICVDEEKTEAAAATAIFVSRSAHIMVPLEMMNIDKPFVFVIKDEETGVFLFIGKVSNPLLDEKSIQ